MANTNCNKVVLGTETLIDLTGDTVTAAKMLSGTKAHDKSGAAVTGSIATKTATDMTASGATVTAPAGYYASAASKSVATGSATTPATTITANPTISVSSGGLITASYSGSKSITPTVSAGYVSAGTAGTVSTSGSNTKQLTAKAATTYNTSTSNQTIAAGQYLTGAQTIRAVTTSNISAANIKSGVTVQVGDAGSAGRIVNVTGTFTSDATATADKILSGYTAYVNGAIVTGTHACENAFAFVVVNYPSGNTLTATNVLGYTDESSTQRIYYVSSPTSGTEQSCVFTITDGTQTKSKTVSGITKGTSQTIILSYALYIVQNGYPQVSLSNTDYLYVSATPYKAMTITQNSDNYYCFLDGQSWTWCSSSIETTNYFTNNGYTTLHADYIAEEATSSVNVHSILYAYSASTRGTYAGYCPHRSEKAFATRYEDTLDISSLGTSSIKVGINLARYECGIAARIYNIWLT